MDKRMKAIQKDLEDMEQITTTFYEGKYSDGFKAMEEGTQKLMLIVDTMMLIAKDNPEKGELDINFINAALTEILNSYEKKDAIMVADLLHFELLDYVKAVLEQWKD